MSVSLVWVTPDAEALIAKTARVSNPQNQDNPDYEKLIKYCIKNNHVSIFEMASMCLEIKCSRAISRQIIRHRSFSFQEFSQRYASVAAEPIYAELRIQDTKNRQNSIASDDLALTEFMLFSQHRVWETALEAYEELLKAGVAKEQARVVLPEGMTPSTFYMSGNIRSWLHFIEVRGFGPGVQKECREVAMDCLEVFKEHFPTIVKAKGWL